MDEYHSGMPCGGPAGGVPCPMPVAYVVIVSCPNPVCEVREFDWLCPPHWAAFQRGTLHAHCPACEDTLTVTNTNLGKVRSYA